MTSHRSTVSAPVSIRYVCYLTEEPDAPIPPVGAGMHPEAVDVPDAYRESISGSDSADDEEIDPVADERDDADAQRRRKEIGRWLRVQREERFSSRKKFERHAGVSESSIYHVENGGAYNAQTWAAYLAGLDLTADDIEAAFANGETSLARPFVTYDDLPDSIRMTFLVMAPSLERLSYEEMNQRCVQLTLMALENRWSDLDDA